MPAALEAVGASHLAPRAPYRLSGGEKRAVAIAGVLAMAPSILVLDEPSTGLDPAGRRRLIELLGRLPQTRSSPRTTWAWCCSYARARWCCTKAACVADGAPARLFADAELLRRCQLESPYEGLKPGRRSTPARAEYASCARVNTGHAA